MRLTREEEQRLGRKALKGDASALDELIRVNLWIVPRIVGSMRFGTRTRRVPRWLREDALQEGYLGLVEAARRFDPRAGARLSTYATYWVKMRVRDLVEKDRRWESKVQKRLDAPALLCERDILDDDSFKPLWGVIASAREEDPTTTAAEKELLERLKAAEEMLPRTLRMMLRRRYWADRSVAGQAESVGMTEEKLRNVLALTFRFLRNQVDEGPAR